MGGSRLSLHLCSFLASVAFVAVSSGQETIQSSETVGVKDGCKSDAQIEKGRRVKFCQFSTVSHLNKLLQGFGL